MAENRSKGCSIGASGSESSKGSAGIWESASASASSSWVSSSGSRFAFSGAPFAPVGEACGPAAPVGTTVCPSAGQLVRANRIKVGNPHRPKITGVDSLRRSAAVESERLGGIAAADVTIDWFDAQGLFGSLRVHRLTWRVPIFLDCFRPGWDILPPED